MNPRLLLSPRRIGPSAGLLWGILAASAAPSPSGGAFRWSALPALPDPVGFAGMYAGASGGALLAAGGANFSDRPFAAGGKKVWHDRVFVLARPDGQWREAGRLPRAAAYGVSGTWRDAVVGAGGCDSRENLDLAWLMRWDGRAVAIETLPPLPFALANACGAVVGDTFYVIGGQERPDSTSALARVLALDLARPPAARRWEGRPWPDGAVARVSAAAGARQGELFLFGGTEMTVSAQGQAVTRDLADAYAFAPGRGWRRLADLPVAVASGPVPALVTGRGHLLLPVPLDTGARPTAPTADFLEYDPGANSWVAHYRDPADAAAPAARYNAPVVRWRGRYAMVSGEVAAGIRTATVVSLEERGGRPAPADRPNLPKE